MFEYLAPNPYPVQGPSVFAWMPSFNFFSRTMAKNVLISLKRSPPSLAKIQQDKIKVCAQYGVEIQSGKVYTYDGATLDTIEFIPHTLKQLPLNERKFIIKFKGQNGFYESTLDDFAHDAISSNRVVIGFNYRGVGYSQKKPLIFQELVTDGIAQVQRLLAAGVNSENILLDSESLGGAIATMVAFHFYEKKTPVYLFNSRSFSSLSLTAVEMQTPMLPTPIKYFLRRIIASMGWEADVAAAYKQIDEKYKRYLVVAKPSEKSTGDTIIPHDCSLHRAVREDEKTKQQLTGYKVLAQGVDNVGHKDKRDNLILKNNRQETAQSMFLFFASTASNNPCHQAVNSHDASSDTATEFTPLYISSYSS
ncbi:MAG: alpha/beta hydrolase [Legionellaceae bacterium]|nr:alpha/beta hydrolase [Legionellaceae bacterium]